MTDTTTYPDHVAAFTDYLGDRKAESTVASYRTYVADFRDWLRADGLTLADARLADVDDHLAERSGAEAPKTTGLRLNALRAFYEYATRRADGRRYPMLDIDEDPTEDISLDNLGIDTSQTLKTKASADGVIYAEPDEVAAIADNVPSPTLRNELLVRLLYQTGIRASEVKPITLDRLDREERSIQVYAPKTEDTRTVYYQASLDSLLTEYLDYGGRAAFAPAAESDRLFVSQRKPYLRRRVVNDIVREGAERAGIQTELYEDAQGHTRNKFTAHTLRHGFAMGALKNGIDTSRLSKLMGHSDTDTTEIYLQEVEADRREAARRYGPSTADADGRDGDGPRDV